MIGEAEYHQAQSQEWSADLCAASQFPAWESYRRCGLGVVAVCDGTGLLVSGASRLILECLDRNLSPSWDAHNMGSVRLAQKLGYHLDGAYVAYEVKTHHGPLLSNPQTDTQSPPPSE